MDAYMRDVFSIITGKMPKATSILFFSRISIIGVITLACIFALISNDIIGYITKMISLVMAGVAVCGLLGSFWLRFNWQGAIAAMLAGATMSLIVMNSVSLTKYWGNPTLPAFGGALLMGIVVSLITPKSLVTREQALAILDAERAQME